MTQEELLSEAQNCYSNCKLLLHSLCSITKEIDVEFDEEKANSQFDLLLQALLFSQAIADGDFCEAERTFIEKLIPSNVLFEHVKSDELGELSWEKVFSLSNEEQGKLSLSLNEALNTYADEFVLPFAILDAGTATNALRDLSQNLAGISILLGAADGEITEDELAVFNHYAEELIIGKWADIKGIAEIMLDGDDEENDDMIIEDEVSGEAASEE